MSRPLLVCFLALYVVLAALLGRRVGRRNETIQRFLHTSRDLPLAVTSLSFLAANCSALEVLSMLGISAKYGLLAVHFYWVGAIPALAFLLCFLLPRYQLLQITRIPEFLQRRFSSSTRLTSALAFCALMIAVSGITLGVAARLAQMALGCSFGVSLGGAGVFVGLFLLGGGLSAVLYAEALQIIVLLLILTPLTWRTLHKAGGIVPLIRGLPPTAQHTLAGLSWLAPQAPADLSGIFLGLGLGLAFTYWCADFLLVQRLYAARSSASALRTPVLAIVVKIALPLLLVVPGLTLGNEVVHRSSSFDLLLPELILSTYSGALGAAAIAVLLVSLLLGCCANIAAAVATYSADVSTSPAPRWLSRVLGDQGIVRWNTLAALLFASACAALVDRSNAVMENVQLVLSCFNVPVGSVFLLGVLIPKLSARAGTPAILAGSAAGLCVWIAGHFRIFGSGLTESFYAAICALATTLLTLWLVHVAGSPRVQIRIRPSQSVVLPQLPEAGVSRSVKLLALFSLLVVAGLYLVCR